MHKWIAAIAALAVLLTVTAVLLLRTPGGGGLAPRPPTHAVPARPAPAARVNGEVIAWGDLVDEILCAYTVEACLILERQVQDAILIEEAREHGLSLSEEEVAQRLQEYEQRIRKETKGQMGLEDVCRLEGQTMDQIRHELRMTIAREKLMRLDGAADGPITEQMITEWQEKKRAETRVRGATTGLPPHLVAVVGGQEIPKAAVVGELLDRMARPTLESLLDGLITDRLLEQKLKQKQLRVTESEIDGLVQEKREMLRRHRAYRRQTLEQALKAQGKSMRDFEKALWRKIALAKLFGYEIPEEKLRGLFDLHKDSLSGKRVRLRQMAAMVIDYRTGKSLGPGADARAKQKIAMLRKKLAAGERFEDLAKKHSEDPLSATNGGDVGFIYRRGTVDDALADAAFDMKKGETRSPVKTTYGYHIVEVTDVDPGKSISFSTERFKLMLQYIGGKENKEVQQGWLKRVREGAEIETFLGDIGRKVPDTAPAQAKGAT